AVGPHALPRRGGPADLAARPPRDPAAALRRPLVHARPGPRAAAVRHRPPLEEGRPLGALQRTLFGARRDDVLRRAPRVAPRAAVPRARDEPGALPRSRRGQAARAERRESAARYFELLTSPTGPTGIGSLSRTRRWSIHSMSPTANRIRKKHRKNPAPKPSL